MPDRRIVFVEAYPQLTGGAQTLTRLLARELPGRGVATEVVTAGSGPLCHRLTRDGITVTELALPDALRRYGHQTHGWQSVEAAVHLPAVWLKLARLLRDRADIAHVNDYRGMLLALPAARLAGIPAIWHIHSLESEPLLTRLGAALATRIVVPSEATLSALGLSVRHRPAARVVPGCVVPEALAAPPSHRSDTPVVVCAARLSPEKGVDVLLRAAAQLRRQVPGVHIRIYGDAQAGFDNYVAGLVGLRTALGVEDMVSFAGLVDCPYSHWFDAAVYVQPSRADSLPLAPLEAMAVGLPVVAASVGGLAEVVADGHSGTLVPPDEPEALADALAELLKDPDRAARMGAAGRQRVERLFTLDRFLDRILEVYTEVADRPPRRPQPRIRRYVLRARS